MDRLWSHAHRRFSVAVADGPGCPDFARRLRNCLSGHLPRRSRADGAARADRPARYPLAARTDRKRTAGPAGQGATHGGAGGAAMSVPILDFVPIWTLILGLGVFF